MSVKGNKPNLDRRRYVHELGLKLDGLLEIEGRAKRGLPTTRAALARALGMSKSYMTKSCAESPEQEPNYCNKFGLNRSYMLAELFGFSVDWPEWCDPEYPNLQFEERPKKCRDTASQFLERYTAENRETLGDWAAELPYRHMILKDSWFALEEVFLFDVVQSVDGLGAEPHHLVLQFSVAEFYSEAREPLGSAGLRKLGVEVEVSDLEIFLLGANIHRRSKLDHPSAIVEYKGHHKRKGWTVVSNQKEALSGVIEIGAPSLLDFGTASSGAWISIAAEVSDKDWRYDPASLVTEGVPDDKKKQKAEIVRGIVENLLHYEFNTVGGPKASIGQATYVAPRKVGAQNGR